MFNEHLLKPLFVLIGVTRAISLPPIFPHGMQPLNNCGQPLPLAPLQKPRMSCENALPTDHLLVSTLSGQLDCHASAHGHLGLSKPGGHCGQLLRKQWVAVLEVLGQILPENLAELYAAHTYRRGRAEPS